jgi:hypothetical protein
MEITEYILYLQLDKARFLQYPSQFNIKSIHSPLYIQKLLEAP